jgi:ribosome-binding factor A
MVDQQRARRLADRIQAIVAETLRRRVKDPRLGFVTITEVRVTGDLQHASIFYTVWGSDEERAESAVALNSAKGLIRSEVGKSTGVRLTPSIEFILDALPDSVNQLEDAITAAALHDEELAKLSVGKSYAGEEDPYRKPAERDDELDDQA